MDGESRESVTVSATFGATPGRTLLIVSQTYVPDPAAVGQHLHDVARQMAKRGWRVVVLTSGRGYDDPTVRYPARESRDGVEIIRLPWSSFGKRTILIRLLGQFLFLLQAVGRGLFLPRLGAILVSTSPPMAALAALVIHGLRRKPVTFWLMDLNPDQAVALGKVRAGSLPVRLFDWMNRRIYAASRHVVVLDRFMADRVYAKLDVRDKTVILPAWAHEEHLEPVPHEGNAFRSAHGWQGKFVFMYSGNMSVASPLTTFLLAAVLLRDDPRLHFVFIGGGGGRRAVEQVMERERPGNITLLPYQPLENLRYSLSAADVHLVTLGNDMVGIIHPCKVYGAMAVARPVLYCGPAPSHIADLLDKHGIGWATPHGDAQACAGLMRRIAATPGDELARMGAVGQRVLQVELSSAKGSTALADVLEK